MVQVAGTTLAVLTASSVAGGMDPLVAASLAAGIGLVLLGLRRPLILLFAFVALVPIEDALLIPGIGTLSRMIGIVFAGVYAVPRIGRLTPGALPVAGWAFIGWAALSMAWAISPGVAQDQLQTLFQMALVGFLIADVVIHDPTSVRPILWVYSISATATAALGIALDLGGGTGTLARLAALGGQNPAQFASLLLPAFVFGFHELVHGRTVVAGGLVALFCTAGMVLSGTRSTWVAAAIVVFVVLLPRLGIRRATVALGIVGLLALITFQIPGVASLVAERAGTAAQTGGAGRTDIWGAGINIFESSPVTGVGYGNFPIAIESTGFRSANISAENLTTIAPHNVIVGSAAELGVVGLALLVLFIGPLIARRGWGPDGPLVQAVLLSLMIDALFIDVFGYRKQVWIAIGLASGLAYLAKQARGTAATSPLADAFASAADAALPSGWRRGAVGLALRRRRS